MTPNPDQPDRRPILGFVAGTPLLTPEGHKPVEQLRPGDVIQGRPAGEVCGVFVTRKPILLLHLNGHVIKTKPDHPFLTSNGWVEAGDLRVREKSRKGDAALFHVTPFCLRYGIGG